MTKLHLDFETRSALNLKEVGLDNYARHSSTRPLMLAWAIDGRKPHLHSWCYDDRPAALADVDVELLDALKDPHVIKYAWNANFERTFLDKLGLWIPYEEWMDPMIYARYLSLPGGLDDFAHHLHLPIAQKDDDGKRLIKLFSMPIKIKKRKAATNVETLFDISPTTEADAKANFNDWNSHPEDWKLFEEYCKQDVLAEREAGEFTEKYFPLPETEKRGWYLDQKINHRGMPADDHFAENSVILAQQAKDNAVAEQKAVTGLANPNSSVQMLAWCRARGYPFSSLRKEPVKIALDGLDLTDKDCRAALTLRGESAKTSYTKLKKIRSAINPHGRLCNQFLFMGSARAGRWSGQDVQLHNMARPVKELEDQDVLDQVRDCIYRLDYDGLKKIYPSVLTAVTSCIRSTFVAPPGKRLNVCDLNAIETRVAAWFCQCAPLMKVFEDGRDPYIDFAAKMFGLEYEVLYTAFKAKDKDAKEKRQIAKPGVLGCVYRLGGGELKKNRYGDTVKGGLWGYAENMGVKMSKEMAHKSVQVFREVYREIKWMWYNLEDAVKKVLTDGGTVQLGPGGCVTIGKKNRKGHPPILWIELPSVRRLHYIDAVLEEKEWPGRPVKTVIVNEATGEKTFVETPGPPYFKTQMSYMGINQETKQWDYISTNGGKLLENIVQAIARDVLLNSMLLADDKGMEIIGHVHDEILTLSDDDPMEDGLDALKWCMSQAPAYMPGFLLTADGYEGLYYRKG